MTEIENYHFATSNVIMDSAKGHQWMLKSISKKLWGTGYLLYSNEVLSHTIPK